MSKLRLNFLMVMICSFAGVACAMDIEKREKSENHVVSILQGWQNSVREYGNQRKEIMKQYNPEGDNQYWVKAIINNSNGIANSRHSAEVRVRLALGNERISLGYPINIENADVRDVAKSLMQAFYTNHE